MQKRDENQVANYIRKHVNYKKWLAFVLCISLLTGTVTLYMMNKPATAMTEEGAETVGLVIPTADSEFEQKGIAKTLENANNADSTGNKGTAESEGGAPASTDEAGTGSDNNGEQSGAATTASTQETEDQSGTGVASTEATSADGESSEEASSSLSSSASESSSDASSTGSTESDVVTDSASSTGTSLVVEDAAGTGSSLLAEETELTKDVVLTVSYVDTKGESLKDEKEINISESIDLAKEAPEIEGYTFKEASIDGTAITAIAVKTSDDGIKYYEVTLADGTTSDVKEAKTVVLTYAGEEEKAAEVKLTAKYVDEDGVSIAEEETLEIKNSLNLTEKAKEIEGYTFKEAALDDKTVTVITSKKDDKDNSYYEATLKDETTVEIKEDKTVVLTYTKDEEVSSQIKLTAKFVDKSGESIAEDKELNITKEKEFKKDSVDTIDGYFFMNVTLDGTKVTKVVPVFEEETEVKDETKKDSESESEKETAKETEKTSDETEARKVKSYTFTTDDGKEVSVDKDAEVVFNYVKATTETEFKFEDEKVTVKATTKVAGAFPEGTKLKVTAVDKDTEGYNYDAYMEALNNNADEIEKAEAKGEEASVKFEDEILLDSTDVKNQDKKKFDETNTLLYDVAFMLDGVEFEPVDGAVSVSVTFNNNQVSEELMAENKENLSVIHLPLVDEVMGEVDATSEAKDITSEDIQVEVYKESDISIDGNIDVVTFETDSFSVIAVVNKKITKNNVGTTWTGENAYSAADIIESLGEARYFGAVANEINGNSHYEANVAVNNYNASFGRMLFDYDSSSGGYIQSNEYKKYKISVVKKSTKPGTFSFALYKDEEAQQQIPGSEFELTCEKSADGMYTATKEITLDNTQSLNDTPSIYVYELYNGRPVSNNSAPGSFTVTYSSDFSESNNGLDALMSSYITNGENIENKLDTLLHENASVYYNASADGWTKGSKNSSGKTYISPQKYSIPIDFVDTMLSDARYISEQLPYLKDTNTVKVFNVIHYGNNDYMSDFRYASNTYAYHWSMNPWEESHWYRTSNKYNWYNNDDIKTNKNTDSGLWINDNQLLVINLDLTGCSNYELGTFVVNGISSDHDAYADYKKNSVASRVIINPVQKKYKKGWWGSDVFDGYEPYTGTLTVQKAMGTVIAPCATINESGIAGSVIGKTINLSGEIHKSTLVGFKEASSTVTITNTGNNVPTGKIVKKWNNRQAYGNIFAYVCARTAGGVELPQYSYLVELKSPSWSADIAFPQDYYNNSNDPNNRIVYRVVEVNAFKNGINAEDGVYNFDDLDSILKSDQKNSVLIYDNDPEEGETIGYSDPINGYVVSYSSNIEASSLTGINNGKNRIVYVPGQKGKTLTITNTEVTDIEVTKHWIASTETPIPDQSKVELTLYSSNDGTNWKAVSNATRTVDKTTNTNDWLYKWTALPKYNNAGTAIKYKVVETKVPDNFESDSDSTDVPVNEIEFGPTKGTATVTNRPLKTQIKLSKKVDGRDAQEGEIFDFKLTRFNDNNSGWLSSDEQVVVKSNASGNVVFDINTKDLGMTFDNNREAYYFRITESGVNEKATKKDYTLDDSWIIAKIDGALNVTYFKFDADTVEGKAAIDEIGNQASELLNYCTDTSGFKVTESNAVFNNYLNQKLEIEKKWTSSGNPVENPNQLVNVKIYRKGTDNNKILLKWKATSTTTGKYEEASTGTEIVEIGSGTNWVIELQLDPKASKDSTYYVQEVLPVNTLVTYKSGSVSNSDWESVPITANNGVFSMTIVNELGGNVLPSTGGVGELPYMATGLGAVVAAVLGSVAYKKKKEEDDLE